MKRITYIIKKNKLVFSAYYCVFSALINVLKFFIKTDNKLILFNSYGGRKFDDSPKALFEAIRCDDRFKDYRLCWAFHNPSHFSIIGAKTVKTNSLSYFITAIKARVWVTNSSFERGLHFCGKKTLYINTWHGSPIKKMGTDIKQGNESFGVRLSHRYDYMNAQSDYEVGIFSKAFGLSEQQFLKVGLPRNDELLRYSREDIFRLRRKLCIPTGKKVILYAPTFREFEHDSSGCTMKPPLDLTKWKKQLGDSYVLLIRAHYEIVNSLDGFSDSFTYDVTDYQNINELLIVSDILISDYSSIIFDFSLMCKPIFLFTYDYELYEEKRGMYFDIRSFFDGSENEDGLLQIIQKSVYNEEMERTKFFRNRFVDYYGNATSSTINTIYKALSD